MQYFITIVESDCNLSAASKKIHVSQPSLSQMIRGFEEYENVSLFERSHGRLERLSLTGELFYNHALEVIAKHDHLMSQLREDSTKLKGKVKIGIPPVVLSAVFTEVMSQLVLNNPDIEFEIVEVGAFELRKKFILQEMDLGVLLEPVDLIVDKFERALLVENEICAFMDVNNPLAQKERLSWIDLQGQPLALFDNSFAVHHLVMEKFEQEKIVPKIVIESGNWDYILRSTIGNDLVTILPSPIYDIFPHAQVKKVRLHDSIAWKVALYRHKKRVYSRVEEYVYQYLLDYFKVEQIV